ncbi:hypothetical protein Fmac_026518 [Flemingia macrophylla]|uniref:Uncharacterized protein n=1 Tax=Flemingia macrophylla TaxID=520843 RepID=A0ABD1LF46_9FABA
MTTGWDAILEENIDDSIRHSRIRGEFIAKSIRVVHEPILSVVFGEDVANTAKTNLMSSILATTERVVHMKGGAEKQAMPKTPQITLATLVFFNMYNNIFYMGSLQSNSDRIYSCNTS